MTSSTVEAPPFIPYTRSCFLVKMIFLPGNEQPLPSCSPRAGFRQSSEHSETRVARIISARTSKIFPKRRRGPVVTIFFVNGTKTEKIAFKLRPQTLSETIASFDISFTSLPPALHLVHRQPPTSYPRPSIAFDECISPS